MDSGSFRRKIAPMITQKVIAPLGKSWKGVAGRPAALYYFDSAAYGKLREEGLAFEV